MRIPILTLALLFNLSSGLIARETRPEFSEAAKFNYVECSPVWDKGSISVSFTEEESGLKYLLLFLNKFRKESAHPDTPGQVVKLHCGENDPHGKEGHLVDKDLQNALLPLLEKAAETEKDEVGKKNLLASIAVLKNRNQSWEEVQKQFAADNREFERKSKNAVQNKRH